jgi:hypothetical protein
LRDADHHDDILDFLSWASRICCAGLGALFVTTLNLTAGPPTDSRLGNRRFP